MSELDLSLLKCLVCKQVPVNVVESTCCGRLYCWECFLRELSKNICSVCHSNIGPEDCREATAIKRLIEAAPVPCKYDGCAALLTVAQRRDHEDSCQYAPILCPNSYLCGIFMRADIERHLNESCPQRVVLCSQCATTRVAFSELQTHVANDCSGTLLECPNRCESKFGELNSFSRGYMQEHLQVCPRSLVPCPYALHGCDSMQVRGNLQMHLQNDASAHLAMLAAMVESQQQEISALKVRAQQPRDSVDISFEAAKQSISVAMRSLTDQIHSHVAHPGVVRVLDVVSTSVANQWNCLSAVHILLLLLMLFVGWGGGFLWRLVRWFGVLTILKRARMNGADYRRGGWKAYRGRFWLSFVLAIFL